MSKGLEGITAAQTTISSIVGTTLKYRGYAIEELAEKASFEEVVYLLWFEKLPNKEELLKFENDLFSYLTLSPQMARFLHSLPREGNTMELLRTCVSALPLYDITPESKFDHIHTAIKLQGQIASLVAAIGRHVDGKDQVHPVKGVSFAENFIYLMSGVKPSKIEIEAMNKALILHADHELNASTFSSRVTVATLSDMISGMTSAIGTLKGPLHGGANEQVMNMLIEINTVERVEAYIQEKINKKEKVMGIGHRVYKDGDPRAAILKEMSKKLTHIVGEDKWYLMSNKIEAMILEQKGLKPNVDFYSASVYHSMKIPSELFTPIFAVSRTSGWIAHMLEQYADNRLIRPRAEYVGLTDETYLPIEKR